VKTIRVSARGGEVEDAGVPPVIVGRFSVSPAELDALFASYVAARVEDGSACHATWSDAATITIDATVRGQHHRGTRCEPDAGADALAAVLGLIAARAR
jgi:hypothetical protein